MRIIAVWSALAAVSVALPAYADTQFTIHQITLPGATSVDATAISDDSAVLGNETDANGEHGFLFSQRKLTLLPSTVPNCSVSAAIYPSSINRRGVIAGAEICAGLTTTFLYYNGSYLQRYTGMGTGSRRLYVGLKENGTIVFNRLADSGRYDAYIFRRWPRRIADARKFSIVHSINAHGTPAGTTFKGCGIEGHCVFFGSVHNSYTRFRTIYPPGAVTASGGYINDHGQVAGTYSTSQGGPLSGFVYSGSQYATFNMPGRADELVLSGMNDSGRVVGVYATSGGPQHAFLYNGSTVTNIADYPAGDQIGMSINRHGVIILADSTGSTTTSYKIHCTGSGC